MEGGAGAAEREPRLGVPLVRLSAALPRRERRGEGGAGRLAESEAVWARLIGADVWLGAGDGGWDAPAPDIWLVRLLGRSSGMFSDARLPGRESRLGSLVSSARGVVSVAGTGVLFGSPDTVGVIKGDRCGLAAGGPDGLGPSTSIAWGLVKTGSLAAAIADRGGVYKRASTTTRQRQSPPRSAFEREIAPDARSNGLVATKCAATPGVGV